MSIKYKPEVGAILICDFNGKEPEMTKRRPVVVLASVAPRLCIVAPLSTTDPEIEQPWHCIIKMPIPLPEPYNDSTAWLKGDMVAVTSYDRLAYPYKGRDKFGNRLYVKPRLKEEVMSQVRRCVAAAIGITPLDF